MQLKKIFISLLVVVVALSTMTFAAAAATNNPSIDLAVSLEGTADADGNVVYKAGDTINVVIDVHNNPGIAILQISLAYDPTILAPVDTNKDNKFDKADCTAGAFLDSDWVFNAPEAGIIEFKTSLAGDPAPIVDANGNIIKDGEVVKLSFKVIADDCVDESVIELTKAYPVINGDKMVIADANITNGYFAIHDLEVVEGKPATCTEKGKTDGLSCKDCEYGSPSVELPALNHPAENREVIPAVPGTCTTPGTSAGEKCALCGKVTVEPVKGDAVAHVASGTWETVKEATHLESGLKQQKCTNCSEVAVTEVIPQIFKHTWVEGKTEAATCTKKGSVEYTCECGESYVKDIDMVAHTFKDTVTAPTAKDLGYTTHVCENCEFTYVDSYVAPTGDLTWVWILIAIIVVLDAASCAITFFITKKALRK